MRKFNRRMAAEMLNQSRGKQPLVPDLEEIAAEGFVNVNECYFLKRLVPKSRTALALDFPDQTGYECFVNSVHVDDFTETNHLPVAWEFMHALIKAWNAQHIALILNVILSSDEMGSVVKCHIARKSQSWLSSDLEKYEDAIMIVDSTFMGGIANP